MRIFLLIPMLLLTTSAVHAVDYCVGSVAQLKQALLDAQSDGAPSVIQIRQGAYVLNESLGYGNPTGREDGALTLRGGYIGGTCLIQTSTPVGTTIAGANTLALTLTNFIELKVEFLTFLSLDVNLNACGSGPSTCQLIVNRNRVQTAQMTLKLSGGTGILRDSLFTNGQNDLALVVDVPDVFALSFGGRMRLVNVSVIDALTRFQGGNFNTAENQSVDIRNSVFSRVGATEIESNRDIALNFSRYDSLVLTNGATVVTSNNTSGQPNLNAQFVPNPGSPLIDRGTASVEGGLSRDVYNEPRVIGQTVDIGAAESPVDGSGVFVVDTTAASGTGSLAAAVAFANADENPNVIRFNIPGGCPKRIARTSALIITDGLTIDGYSQPGSSLNTSSTRFNAEPCIILDGNNRAHDGIVAGPELSTKNEAIRVRGLAFEDFQTALELDEGISHIVQGNQFGGTIGNLSGSDAVLERNGSAVTLSRNAPQFATIGGPQIDDSNLVVGTSFIAITISSDNNTLANNQIGYDNWGVGSSEFDNAFGVLINGEDNLVVDNRFGNHGSDAVRIGGAGASGNRVANNEFGGFLAAAPPVNFSYGVFLFNDAHDNTVGPGNVFIGNEVGVRLSESAGGRNRITRNGMSDQTGLGIDLDVLGVTPNDIDASLCNQITGCASNGDQNFPVLSSASFPLVGPLGRPLQVSGSLRSLVRGTPYEVEFFVADQCDPSGHGEGARFLDSIEVKIENTGFCQANNCTKAFTGVFIAAADVEPNDYLVATATTPSGDTSEFSQCRRILARDLVFTDGFE